MAYYGVQVRDERDPALAAAIAEALGEQRIAFGADDGPASWDRASDVDAEGYRTISSASGTGTIQLRSIAGMLSTANVGSTRTECVTASGMSGKVEEHFYWGSARGRFPVGQHDPLWAEGEPRLTADGAVRTVVLHENACLIRSGQDITDTGEQ